MKDATPPWIQSKSTVPCYLDLCMQLYRYKSEIAEFELNIFWLSNQIFFVGDLNIFSLVQHNIHGSPGVCGLSPVLRSLHATVHPPTCRFPRHSPQSAAQPSPGETGEQLCGAQRGEELDTVSQGQEGGGTSAVVRWWGGWLVTRPVMQVETEETLLAFHIQQLESSRTFYTHSTHFILKQFWDFLHSCDKIMSGPFY